MYYLVPDRQIIFPHPSLSSEDGILGIGGDLSVKRLILAYKYGIFPWYNEGDPIIWWCPNPRLVMRPKDLKVAKSMRPYFNQKRFTVTFDQDFAAVIQHCADQQRKGQSGTWITNYMMSSYIDLHHAGYAHSVEVWQGNDLVGGLYGITLGNVFYGESMFTLVSNASKFGFISLVKALEKANFSLIDCQQETKHLKSLGAYTIPRDDFLKILKNEAFDDPKRLFWDDMRQNYQKTTKEI